MGNHFQIFSFYRGSAPLCLSWCTNHFSKWSKEQINDQSDAEAEPISLSNQVSFPDRAPCYQYHFLKEAKLVAALKNGTMR